MGDTVDEADPYEAKVVFGKDNDKPKKTVTFQDEKSQLPDGFGKSNNAGNVKPGNLKKFGKEIQLEKKLEMKYGGKALKMLEKMGGYKLGEGVGKNNQGILNPIEMVIVDKGGLGYQSTKPQKAKKPKNDDIDMDIHNKVEEEKQK